MLVGARAIAAALAPLLGRPVDARAVYRLAWRATFPLPLVSTRACRYIATPDALDVWIAGERAGGEDDRRTRCARARRRDRARRAHELQAAPVATRIMSLQRAAGALYRTLRACNPGDLRAPGAARALAALEAALDTAHQLRAAAVTRAPVGAATNAATRGME